MTDLMGQISPGRLPTESHSMNSPSESTIPAGTRTIKRHPDMLIKIEKKIDAALEHALGDFEKRLDQKLEQIQKDIVELKNVYSKRVPLPPPPLEET